MAHWQIDSAYLYTDMAHLHTDSAYSHTDPGHLQVGYARLEQADVAKT